MPVELEAQYVHGVRLAKSSPPVVRVIRSNNLGDKLYHKTQKSTLETDFHDFDGAVPEMFEHL